MIKELSKDYKFKILMDNKNLIEENDEYINEILLNATESSIDKDEKRIREVYHCNEFYNRYIKRK